VPGARYQVACRTRGGARCRLIISKGGADDVLVDSGRLDNGEASTFAWPAGNSSLTLRVEGAAPGARARILLVRR
jgi:hypothetical protein